ncbi:MAG: DUF1549 domain-containing protein [Verrucomicrobiota bacterium]
MKFLSLLLVFAFCGATPALWADDESEPKKQKRVKKGANSRLPKWPDPKLSFELPEIGNAAPVEASTDLWLPVDSMKKGSAMIDKAVVSGLAAHDQTLNPPASDEVFVRRIYLDIAGRIPTATETRAFLSNTDREKRRKLIDELLVSDGYRSHMFNWLADMLRHKSRVGLGRFDNYERWLKDQIAVNRKWNEVVSELLTAEGTLASSGPTGYLLRDAGMPLDNLSNTLNLFLGANVSCAQCHDHPFADWTQKQFYEMAAYFGSTYVSSRDARKIANIFEKEGGKRPVGIAVAQSMHAVHQLDEQSLTFPEDYMYINARPGSKVQPDFISWEQGLGRKTAGDESVSEEELRKSFADWMTAEENPRFAVSIANRVWKRAFGIAVQEPVEDLDDLEKASNPVLVKGLGKVMVMLKFDLREFQRVIFNTKTYQAKANATPPIGEIDKYLFSGPVLRRMTAEQAWDSILFLNEGPEVDDYKVDRSHRVTRFDIPYDRMTTELLGSTLKEMNGRGYMRIANDLDFPEGVEPRKVRGSYLVRASELEQPAPPNHFLRMFGQSARELADDSSREGNIPQTLMLMNGDFQSLLTGRDSQLMRTVSQHRNPQDQIEELYLSFFNRNPTREENVRVEAAMKDGASLGELVWVLFNTPEFMFVQ